MAQDRLRQVNRRIQRYFDERAERWDEIMPSDVAERVAELMARLDVRAGQWVLDVAAGTGTLAAVLLPRVGPEGRVVSMDIAWNMARMIQRRQMDRRAAPLQADAVQPPFGRGAFDWVICNNCFPHFEDQPRTVQELGCALKPGGRLVVCHTNSREGINAHHREVGGLVGGHELPDDATMRSYFEAAGLSIEQFENAEAHYLVTGRGN